jgi:rSAM/selenodomain-associated transferase 2
LKLSVVIPTLNEAGIIGPLVVYLRHELSGRAHEIIISDGGSTDETVSEAEAYGARATVSAKRGRAHQMNHGARCSDGDVLYFLHADSKPPAGFYDQIASAVQAGHHAGCFRLKFDESNLMLKIYSWFTRFDFDWFRFGDQSLFVQEDVFNEIDGFDEKLRIMEDQEIVRSIRKAGGNFLILHDEVVTSARKYRENGVIRLQAIFTLIVIFYYCGAGQDILVHLYKSLIIPSR